MIFSWHLLRAQLASRRAFPRDERQLYALDRSRIPRKPPKHAKGTK